MSKAVCLYVFFECCCPKGNCFICWSHYILFSRIKLIYSWLSSCRHVGVASWDSAKGGWRRFCAKQMVPSACTKFWVPPEAWRISPITCLPWSVFLYSSCNQLQPRSKRSQTRPGYTHQVPLSAIKCTTSLSRPCHYQVHLFSILEMLGGKTWVWIYIYTYMEQ